jgi:regulatory protein
MRQLSLKARALRYLSMREHSRLELGRKLARYAEEGDDIEALLDFLEKNNWLSQERFAESLIHRKAVRPLRQQPRAGRAAAATA